MPAPGDESSGDSAGAARRGMVAASAGVDSSPALNMAARGGCGERAAGALIKTTPRGREVTLIE